MKMSVDTMAILTLCEFIGIALIIYGFLRRDKLIKFERGAVRVAAVYVAVFKAWRKEKRNERINER
jgi:hypothetical protein